MCARARVRVRVRALSSGNAALTITGALYGVRQWRNFIANWV